MEWTVETLNHTVDEELNALPADMRARFTHVVVSSKASVDRVGQPHVKHLQGRLWECAYGAVTALPSAVCHRHRSTCGGGQSVVKKTQKTPRREMELALERAKEIWS